MRQIDKLPGVGAKTKEILNNHFIYTIDDLLYYYPKKYESFKETKVESVVESLPAETTAETKDYSADNLSYIETNERTTISYSNSLSTYLDFSSCKDVYGYKTKSEEKLDVVETKKNPFEGDDETSW